jgi:hypothetical protein
MATEHVVTAWRTGDRTHIRARAALSWILAGAVALPIVVLSHEAGHTLIDRAFGFPGPVLHYGSSDVASSNAFWDRIRAGDRAGAAAILPPWQVALGIAGGLVVTVATLLMCCIVARRRPHPLVIAVGLVTPLRTAIISTLTVIATFGARAQNGSDEVHLAMLTGIRPSRWR